MTDTNMLAVGDLIVEYLTTELPDIRIRTAGDLDMLEDSKGKGLPAVFVIPDGFSVGDQNPRAVQVSQTWITAVAVRNTKFAQNSVKAYAEAGTLAYKVAALMQNWRAEGYTPMKMASPPAPVLTAGILVYPLTWTCVFPLKV